MNLPDSVPALAVLILLVFPGVTYSWAKRLSVGWRSPSHDVSTRVFEALTAGAAFALTYLLAGALIFRGSPKSFAGQVEHVWETWPVVGVALLAILLLALLPTLAGWSLNARFGRVEMADGSMRLKQVNRVSGTPRGWEKAAYGAITPRFVRVRTSTGHWVGGWFDAESLISAYPFPRDLFIEAQWRLTEEGDFLEPVPGTLGVWVAITDDAIAEWVAAEGEADVEGESFDHR